MRFDDVVSNVNIYGLEESVKGAELYYSSI